MAEDNVNWHLVARHMNDAFRSLNKACQEVNQGTDNSYVGDSLKDLEDDYDKYEAVVAVTNAFSYLDAQGLWAIQRVLEEEE